VFAHAWVWHNSSILRIVRETKVPFLSFHILSGSMRGFEASDGREVQLLWNDHPFTPLLDTTMVPIVACSKQVCIELMEATVLLTI
jgi:hypothetical protein